MLTLTGDSDTWSVTLYAAAADRPLKRLRHADAFTAVVRALPRHAHWLEGEPLTGVLPMGGVIDRIRPAAPRTPGVLSVGDAWACTNPTLGRGIAVGLVHVALLRDVVRERLGDGLADAWRERTDAELGHFYDSCVASDRGRLAAMAAHREGREPPVPATTAEAVGAALPLAMGRDADAFRAGLEIIGCLAPAHEVLARPGLAERRARPCRLGAAAGARARRPAGPDRRLSRPAAPASVVSPRGCAAGSRSRATSRCRCRGRACRTASTARSRRISRTCTRRTRSSALLDRAARRNVKELLVLTGDDPGHHPGVRARLAELGFDDFVAYVAWACERALERGIAPAHEPRRARRATTSRGCAR